MTTIGHFGVIDPLGLESFFTKYGCRGCWGQWGCRGLWGQWGCRGFLVLNSRTRMALKSSMDYENSWIYSYLQTKYFYLSGSIWKKHLNIKSWLVFLHQMYLLSCLKAPWIETMFCLLLPTFTYSALHKTKPGKFRYWYGTLY